MTAQAAHAVNAFHAFVQERARGEPIDLSVLTKAALDTIELVGAELAFLPLWASCREAEDDPLVVRLASFLVAQYAADLKHEDAWVSLLWLVSPPRPRDPSAVQNSLTALQRNTSLPDGTLRVLRREVGPLLLEALGVEQSLESVSDVILAYADAQNLEQVLAPHDASLLAEQLTQKAKSAAPPVSEAATYAATSLRDGNFAQEVPSAAQVLRDEVAKRQAPHGKDEWSEVLKRTDAAVRDVLEGYAALEDMTEEAVTRKLPAQSIRVRGGWASLGRLPIDFLEKLLHGWRRLYTSVREAVGGADDTGAKIFVLAPARGSFVVRVIVETDSPEVDVRVADALSRGKDDLGRSDSRSLDLTGTLFQELLPILRLAAESSVDVEVAVAVPGGPSRRRRIRIGHRWASATITSFSPDVVEAGASEQMVGVLEGANHRSGKFEMLPNDGDAVAGTVAKAGRSILLDKIIGGSYVFDLRRTPDPAGGNDKWELHGLSSLGGEPIPAAATREVLAPSPDVITSGVLPQVDSLERITEVVQVIASGKVLSQSTVNLSTRHVAYHKHAARCLLLLDADGTLTEAGAILVKLPKSRRLDHLAIQFEVSIVGHAWLQWAKATGVDDLDPESAFAFLKNRSDLKPSMVDRRGRTLRRWARDLRARPSKSVAREK